MAVRKRTYVDFRRGAPAGAMSQATGLQSAVTDDIVNVVTAPGGVTFEIRNEQANAQIVPAYVNDTDCTSGWELPLDNTDGDGIEFGQGILGIADAPYAFKIGTDGAFKLSVKFGIPVVLDHSLCAVGFRTAQAYGDAMVSAATLDTAYGATTNEYALFNILNGDIYTLTSATGAAVTATDNTDNWAADAVKTLTVLVSSAGVVTFQIDGAAPTVNTNTLTFATDTYVIPCFIVAKDATATADTPPILATWFCGLQ